MSGMSSEQRVTLTYVGDDAVKVGGWVDPVPAIVEPGQDVEVASGAVEALLASGRFTAAGNAPDILRGEQLDAALRDAGLPLTGTADDKRQRLAEHHAAEAAGLDSTDDTETE